MAPKVESSADQDLLLPTSIVSSIDIRRLNREIEALEEYVAQATARKVGGNSVPPRTSRLLDELATANHLNLLQAADRTTLRSFLQKMQAAPTIHISFSADPSAAFTQKIVAWLRKNIDSHLLLQVGLQPTIAAGCIVRTENKVFDFSLRQNFTQKRQVLIDAVSGAKHE